MTYKELFYLIGHCLSLDEHPEFSEAIIKKIQDDEIVWEDFVQLCDDHLIIPVIYLKFKSHRLLDFIPEDLTLVFKEIYDLNREHNQQILQQIDKITVLLNQENIQPVFLKGTANLLDGLYSDLGERMIGDIDLLVQENDYLKAGALLESIGYQHDEKISYVDFSDRKHYPGLSKTDEPAMIEIHRLLVSKSFSAALKPELVFENKKPIPGRPHLFVPSDEHKLIHTFLHSELEDSGHQYKQSGFRGIYDLLLLSKRIDLSGLAGLSGYRNRFISWLVFSERVLNLTQSFYHRPSNRAKYYCWKYDLSLSFVRTYRAYVWIKKIIYLIGVRYLGVCLKAIFYRKERQALYRRLSHRDWYREHWEHYKGYFS